MVDLAIELQMKKLQQEKADEESRKRRQKAKEVLDKIKESKPLLTRSLEQEKKEIELKKGELVEQRNINKSLGTQETALL